MALIDLSTERQMATWTSPVYQHFKMPPDIASGINFHVNPQYTLGSASEPYRLPKCALLV